MYRPAGRQMCKRSPVSHMPNTGAVAHRTGEEVRVSTHNIVSHMRVPLTADFFRRHISQATLTWILFFRLKGAALWLRLACPDSEGVGLGIAGRSGLNLRSICWRSRARVASLLPSLYNGQDPGIYINASRVNGYVHISSELDRYATGPRRMMDRVRRRRKDRDMHEDLVQYSKA